MEDTSGAKEVKTFSEGYKVICRFFKKIGLYREFLDYQYSKDSLCKYVIKIPTNTIDPIADFAKTSISYYLFFKKRICPTLHLYPYFIIFCQHFYPEFYEKSDKDFNNVMGDIKQYDFVVDKDNKVFIIKKLVKWRDSKNK